VYLLRLGPGLEIPGFILPDSRRSSYITTLYLSPGPSWPFLSLADSSPSSPNQGTGAKRKNPPSKLLIVISV
jgi:hypothetical protein